MEASSMFTTRAKIALREIRDAGVDQKLANDFQIVQNVAKKLPQFLQESKLEDVQNDLNGFLSNVVKCTGGVWSKIEKRSDLHTAVLYVFFRVVEEHFNRRFVARGSFAMEFPHLRSHPQLIALMTFANYISLMSKFIEPSNNKQVFMLVAGSLETVWRDRFVTGGAQRPETSDRVAIFHELLNVRKRNRSAKRTSASLELLLDDPASDGSRDAFFDSAMAFASMPPATKKHCATTFATTPSPITSQESHSSSEQDQPIAIDIFGDDASYELSDFGALLDDFLLDIQHSPDTWPVPPTDQITQLLSRPEFFDEFQVPLDGYQSHEV